MTKLWLHCFKNLEWLLFDGTSFIGKQINPFFSLRNHWHQIHWRSYAQTRTNHNYFLRFVIFCVFLVLQVLNSFFKKSQLLSWFLVNVILFFKKGLSLLVHWLWVISLSISHTPCKNCTNRMFENILDRAYWYWDV